MNNSRTRLSLKTTKRVWKKIINRLIFFLIYRHLKRIVHIKNVCSCRTSYAPISVLIYSFQQCQSRPELNKTTPEWTTNLVKPQNFQDLVIPSEFIGGTFEFFPRWRFSNVSENSCRIFFMTSNEDLPFR